MPAALLEGAPSDDPGLSEFASALAAVPERGYVVGLAERRTGATRILRGTEDDAWVPGPYAGSLLLDGRELAIEPRMGWSALRSWVESATELSVDRLAGDARGAAPYAALMWVRAVDGASRHGPPAFRRDVPYVGSEVRGRLDVRRTVRLRAKGASGAASVYRARDLDNPVTRVIVAADRVLRRRVGPGRWRTDRVEDILPQLYTAVGRRAPVPGDRELHRMRYTPITRPFKWAGELSVRIVRQDPVATTAVRGRPQGLLLDLETVWMGAALNWVRHSRPELHADRDGDRIVLRDAHRLRAVIATRSGTAADGAPLLTIVPGGGGARRSIELAPDAIASAALVDAELSLL